MTPPRLAAPNMRLLSPYVHGSAGRLRCLHTRSNTSGRVASVYNPILNPNRRQSRTSIFTSSRAKREATKHKGLSTIPMTIIFGALFIWCLYPSDEFNDLSDAYEERHQRRHRGKQQPHHASATDEGPSDGIDGGVASSTWDTFSSSFKAFSNAAESEWTALSDKIVETILPDWSKLIPGYVRKLQRELSMVPGSVADEIWRGAHDPSLHPEVRYAASVRVSTELCDEEKEFLARRKRVTKVALARYLDMEERDIHPDDVPVVAVCGSGGGLRALVAGTGSLLSADEDGLFDCVTYTSGVSGSCWLQVLYNSSIGERSLPRVLEHLKARAGVHIAYPPVAFQALLSAPTSKYLLAGLVEKLRGDPKADFGIVDVYGLLLAARFLVPRGELGIQERDLKLSSQRDYIKYGQSPMPIYTAVRHEIPGLHEPGVSDASAKEEAKKEAWFQWFEMTPYEFFCEEFAAGIPMWALGRRFDGGVDVPPESEPGSGSDSGFHMPEVRVPFLLGVFGSAFCATLSHYYREIRPLVQSVTGFGALDDVISSRYNEDLSKVHPIDPGTVANYIHGMRGMLPATAPDSIYDEEYIQLMDAGMSNNLPLYPLLRPDRGVEVLVIFDASADIKTDNWLAVADGYARQRGIKGWPVGIGWPNPGETSQQLERDLQGAEASSTKEAAAKLQEAKREQETAQEEQQQFIKPETYDKPSNTLSSSASSKSNSDPDDAPSDSSTGAKFNPGDPATGDLGYCTVWVGTTQERSSAPPPPSKALTNSTSWQLTEPDAGIAVAYLPFVANPDKVPGVNPGTSHFLSTWNFVYTPEQVEQVAALARANYAQGKAQIRETVRAVYLRKKRLREVREEAASRDRYRRRVQSGMGTRLGEGDQFS